MRVSRIAILGATSQIAKDLVAGWSQQDGPEVTLFARNRDAVLAWATGEGVAERCPVREYAEFGAEDHDVILNFVGVGDPARAAHMGRDIFDVTQRFDQMALDYLDRHPDCRYLFLSSGAAYGNTFLAPVDDDTPARIPINAIAPQDYYSVAKLYAECRHRARPDDAIIDIRVFNYFSRTQNLNARFFITDILRAIRDRQTLRTTDQPMVRDFLHPSDFRQLVDCLLSGPRANLAVDCFSRAPVDKATLLEAMHREFGLIHVVDAAEATVNATGAKPNYYSLSRRAARFGYAPRFTSLEGVVMEAAALLS